jgi:CTP:molybdopterin cytidylyltransferase MocA
VDHNQPLSAPAAVISAGGSSERMRCPKALLPFRDRTFVEKIIADYRRLNCRPIVVVVGVHEQEIRKVLDLDEVKIAVNPLPKRGPFSSLQVGLQALAADVPGFFHAPVDHPAVQVETLKEMLRCWRGDDHKAVRPRFKNRGGHPVLFGREWIEEILKLPATSNLRELMRRRSDRVIELSVTDAGVLINVDTPKDYEKLLRKEKP